MMLIIVLSLVMLLVSVSEAVQWLSSAHSLWAAALWCTRNW